MKDVSKAKSPSRDALRSKNNRQRLERMLRKMLYSEANGAWAGGFPAPVTSFTPYRRVIE